MPLCSVIKCKINNSDENDISTKIICRFTEGNGRCGKRFLRKPIRETVVENLHGKSAMAYRAEMAEQYMDHNDIIEPPHLYSAEVLRTAKHEILKKKYIHEDPIKALHIMKFNKLAGIIHNIGLDPFYVHYWGNYQLDVYRAYAASEPACVYTDATGSIVKKIRKPDNSNSKHIFLYNCVINCDRGGLFPVAQILTESHNTNSIQFWLIEWIRSGAPRPREVVCDFSKALLIATVRSFSGYLTIENYTDACKDVYVPDCYIRIDVAHFIKKYATFLKDVRIRIRQFYLSLLGQLILCRNEEMAKILLTSILVIARSETEGVTQDGTLTICEEHKIKIKSLMSSTMEENLFENMEAEDDTNNEEHEDNNVNKWTEWAKTIENDIMEVINIVEGNRENAHYLPKFADRIMKDIKYLPMWSSICRDKFGYGRVPASSASVEGDFNIIKNVLLKNEETPMRVDEFVSKHINFLSGHIKLAHSKQLAEEDKTEEPNKAKLIDINNDTIELNYEIINVSSITNPCPVCANGDKPTGDHKCYICKKAVHAIDGCSAPLGEEGYGQARICKDCSENNIVNDILPTREVENWRGLATTKEKKTRSKYLQTDNIENQFLFNDKITKIPIMKNGGNITMQSVKLDNKRFSFTNTCAFDSILQLFIAAYFDKHEIKNFISLNNLHIFFQLVVNIATHGVRKHSYRLRAQVLNEIFTGTSLPNNCILIDCAVNIGSLCSKLFTKYPPFSEISRCSNGCTERKKIFPLLHADINLLLHQDFNAIENNILIQGSRSCCQTNCNGFEITTFSHTGNY